MRRREILKAIPAATVGLGALGSVGSVTAHSHDTDNERGCELSGSHPHEEALKFRWYDGDDWRIDAGPNFLLDMHFAAGRDNIRGRIETARHAEDYAQLVYDSHEVWREHSSLSRITSLIRHHIGDLSGVAGITVWEERPGHNRAPDDWDGSEEDFTDWYKDWCEPID